MSFISRLLGIRIAQPISSQHRQPGNDQFDTVLTKLIGELKSASTVMSESGVLDNDGWTEEIQKKMVNVCIEHVMKVQTLHNKLVDVGRSGDTDELHQQALM